MSTSAFSTKPRNQVLSKPNCTPVRKKARANCADDFHWPRNHSQYRTGGLSPEPERAPHGRAIWFGPSGSLSVAICVIIRDHEISKIPSLWAPDGIFPLFFFRLRAGFLRLKRS